MSVISEEFYKIISKKIFDLRGVIQFGQVEQPQHNQCTNRSALIFILDSVLHLHRQAHATHWSALEGRKALDHLLLHLYKWPLSEIRTLSLSDVILALQDQLMPDKLPEEVKTILRSYGALSVTQSFTDFMDEEWDPDLYLTIPKQQNW